MIARFRMFALAGIAATVSFAAPAEARYDDPLPRFEDPICPGVVGMKVDVAETLVGLIRGNLDSLDRPVSNEDTCVPNVVVAFIEDGASYVRVLSEQNNEIFFEMPREEREALIAEDGGARAVLRVRARSRDGMPIPRRENLMDIPTSEMWQAHSKIYTATRNDILSALVLIDRSQVAGLSLPQLADYVTFRALTHTMPPEAARDNSIVSLFDGPERQKGLTDYDRKFLTTLYDGMPNIPGSARIASLEKATGTPFE